MDECLVFQQRVGGEGEVREAEVSGASRGGDLVGWDKVTGGAA